MGLQERECSDVFMGENTMKDDAAPRCSYRENALVGVVR